MAAVALPEQPLIEPLPGNPSFERGSTNLDTVALEPTEAGFDEGNTEILSPTHSATNSSPVANDDVCSRFSPPSARLARRGGLLSIDDNSFIHTPNVGLVGTETSISQASA